MLILVVSTFLGGLGQLFFKLGVAGGVLSIAAFFILIGIVSYGISLIMYLYVLGRAHLGWVYGFGGLSYVFASLMAILVLREHITLLRWTGIALIAVGTALIGKSSHS